MTGTANTPTAGEPLSTDEAHVVYQAIMRVLRAATRDGFIGERLALADTTVEVHFTDCEPALSLTMLCDRAPVEVLDAGTGGAEVHIHGSMRDCVRFMAGDLHLAMAIAGTATPTGALADHVLERLPDERRLLLRQV